jgi:hypothetical protein
MKGGASNTELRTPRRLHLGTMLNLRPAPRELANTAGCARGWALRFTRRMTHWWEIRLLRCLTVGNVVVIIKSRGGAVW